ncbi:hypothetical protein PV327_001727 [Microctonus hyperodae]|uniref:Uncharacterized protein n=1 Tax=Microctonus hyperodae TaxID=165561 RepID=A0AA39FE30_MICHY|nr:hypothetical protein PV327_001727 [Microctonus hyperodae]
MVNLEIILIAVAFVSIVNADGTIPMNATITRKPVMQIWQKYRQGLDNATKEVEESVEHGVKAVVDIVKSGLKTQIDVIQNIKNTEALVINSVLNHTTKAIDRFGENAFNRTRTPINIGENLRNRTVQAIEKIRGNLIPAPKNITTTTKKPTS